MTARKKPVVVLKRYVMRAEIAPEGFGVPGTPVVTYGEHPEGDWMPAKDVQEALFRLSAPTSRKRPPKRRVASTPYREALRILTGCQPPAFIRHHWPDGADADKAQDWAASHVPDWLTGYGVLEAAESMVAASLENGNFTNPTLRQFWSRETIAAAEAALNRPRK